MSAIFVSNVKNDDLDKFTANHRTLLLDFFFLLAFQLVIASVYKARLSRLYKALFHWSDSTFSFMGRELIRPLRGGLIKMTLAVNYDAGMRELSSE